MSTKNGLLFFCGLMTAHIVPLRMRHKYLATARDTWFLRMIHLFARVEAEFDTYRVLFEAEIGRGGVVDDYSDGYMRSMRAICNVAKAIADVLIAFPDMGDTRLKSQREFVEKTVSDVRRRVVGIVEETLAYPFNDPRRIDLLGRLHEANDELQNSGVFERLRCGSKVSEADREALFGIVERVREGCVRKRLSSINRSTSDFMRGFRSRDNGVDQIGITGAESAASKAPLSTTHGRSMRVGRATVRGMNVS